MMYKVIILLSFLFLLTACPPNCGDDYQEIDLGLISQELLNKVPYEDGEVYSFKHNEGLVIPFTTVRTSSQKETFCEWSCCERYIYESNSTKLTSSYPIFDISFSLSNLMDAPDFSDSLGDRVDITVGVSNFEILIESSETFDIVQINGINYSDVYKLARANYDNSADSSETEVYVDSLYYNYEKGILKISMTNNEYYAINE